MEQVHNEYVRRLKHIFKKHNPPKVAQINSLLTKYKDREQYFYERVCKKYNVDILPKPSVFTLEMLQGQDLSRNIQVFCRFRPPNAMEQTKELEFMFKKTFNMDLKDYEIFRKALDESLAATGPITVEIVKTGEEEEEEKKSVTKLFNDFETEDLVIWLESLQLSEYKRFFRTKKINGPWLRNPPPYNEKRAMEITKTEVINFRRANQSHRFEMDGVLNEKCTQQNVFEMVGQDLVNSVIGGFNATVFAYGQTGTGKTHTMFAPEGGRVGLNSDTGMGLIPRCISTIIERMSESKEVEEFDLNLAIMEIYREKIRDLLTPGVKLQLRYVGRDSQVDNLSWWKVTSPSEALNYIETAMERRQTATHLANLTSSRSHAIITLKLTSTLANGNVQTSRFNFGDLAGSERATKTGVQGQNLREAQDILKSLFALQDVIRALSEKRAFVPYHGSMLTKLLRDSLGGNSRTSIIITASPHEYNRGETVSTLQFGEQAKKIANEPKCNRLLSRDEMESQMSSMQEELQYLRRLNAQNRLGAPKRRSNRVERKSISQLIRRSSLLLISPNNRPGRGMGSSPIGGSPPILKGFPKNFPIPDKDIGEPLRIMNEGSAEDDSDVDEDTMAMPSFMRSRTVIMEKEDSLSNKNDAIEDGNEDDSKEIELLQEQLTAINVQFKELQIQNIEKDNQLLSLEKNLQEKINEISRINSKNAVLVKCREDLLEQSKEVFGLEQRILELEEEIRVLKAPKVKPVNTSLYITFD